MRKKTKNVTADAAATEPDMRAVPTGTTMRTEAVPARTGKRIPMARRGIPTRTERGTIMLRMMFPHTADICMSAASRRRTDRDG